MSAGRRILVVAGAELRLRRRRPLALGLALVAPALLATLVGLSLGTIGGPELRLGVTGPDDQVRVAVAAVDERADPGASVSSRAVASEAAGRRAVRDADLDAVLVLPPPDADPARVTVLVGPGSGTSAAIAERIGDLVAARLGTGAATTERGDLGPVERRVVDGQPAGGRLAQAVTVMMAYFVAGQAAEAMLRNRERGILARLAPSAVRPGEVLAGTLVVVLLLGLLATALALVATHLAFPDLRWGPGPGVVLVAGATVAAVSAIGVVPAGLVRTAAQSQGVTALLAFGLALASGTLSLPDQVAPGLQRLRRFTPNGWALDGFTRLAGDGSVRATLPSVLALSATAAVALAVGWHLVARRGP